MKTIRTLSILALSCTCFARAGEIHEAVKKGDMDSVKALLKAKVELANAEDESSRLGDKPLHLAAYKGYKAIAEVLLASKADVNGKTGKGGSTALIYAANSGQKEMVAWLIEKGAEVNASDNSGHTALHFAAIKGHREIVEMLLDHKADLNAPNSIGKTPLQLAELFHHKDIADLLRKAGAKE